VARERSEVVSRYQPLALSPRIKALACVRAHMLMLMLIISGCLLPVGPDKVSPFPPAEPPLAGAGIEATALANPTYKRYSQYAL
jgi:hypothetical protein